MNRFIVSLGLAALLMVLTMRDASAQGTCVCNSGCHDMPGQCLISGTGCVAGYAPLCDYRPAGTCPHVGAVSCSGSCTCTPIPGWDAGTVDVVIPPDTSVDVTVADVPPVDVPPVDVTGMDIPPPPDVPGVDVQPDVNPCPIGVVVDGTCYSTPCQYQTEIGFVCTMTGYSCRTIDGLPWCIPVCAGASCASGEYCDPRYGCSPTPDGGINCASLSCAEGEVCDPVKGCGRDQCTNVSCPTGEYCVSGGCVPLPDGSTADASIDANGRDGGSNLDGHVSEGGAPDGGNTPRTGGCGCRTVGDPSGSRSGSALIVALSALALVFARRRRSNG